LPYVTWPLEQGYAPGGFTAVSQRALEPCAEVTPEERQAAFEAAMKHGGGPPQLGPPLPSAANAVERYPELKVLVAAGRYDSLNSCAANAELARSLEGVLKAAYAFKCYEGGHMMYLDHEARVQLARDVTPGAADDRTSRGAPPILLVAMPRLCQADRAGPRGGGNAGRPLAESCSSPCRVPTTVEAVSHRV
jgi:hypothetical protein